jgi:phosphoglycerol transferase MdoB-like AlkP superfamily enzyme
MTAGSTKGWAAALRRAAAGAGRLAPRYTNLWLVLGLQLWFYREFTMSRVIIIDHAERRGFVLAASVVAMVGLLNVGLARLRSRRLAALLNIGFVAFYLMLLLYRSIRGAPLDFALLATNPGELFSTDGVYAVASAGGARAWAGFGAFLAGLFALEWRFRALSTFHHVRRPGRLAAALAVANLFFLRAWSTSNELLLFARSALQYALHPYDEQMRHADAPERYPLFHAPRDQRPPAFPPERRPNLFLVFLESYWAGTVGERDPAGREITPFFNELSARSAYHSLFFANSMQTERGQSATLCSTVPSYRRKIMTAYYDDHLLCLPEILRSAGYATVWAQGQPKLSFDNTGPFMEKIGFEHVFSMDDRFVTPEEKQRYAWGWGLRDDLFFRKAFARLDELAEGRGDRPLFAALATISNHTVFNAMPEDERPLYPQPATFREQYLNSMRLADGYLRAFFDELGRREALRDSVVVLLGDHGAAVGQHGFNSNEVAFYDELFHVPLLVLGPGAGPFRNDAVAYSQLDVAPSILEWLGISRPNHFVGVPVPYRAADLPSEQHWIPLVQPYDGGYLISLRYPFKYVRGLSSGESKLFDLAHDPHEDHDLAPDWGWREPLPQLADELSRIFLNQRLLDEDRLLLR